MVIGFLLVITAGLLWIGIGVSVSLCAKRGWNYNVVQGINYLVASLACLVLMGANNTDFFTGANNWTVFLFCCLAGFANYGIYILTAKAMQCGPNGLVWGIMQSGMIGTFLMGLVFFHEKAALLQLTGLVLILGGILAMGFGKNNDTKGNGRRWILFSLGAMALSMTTQCFNILPSYFSDTSGVSSLFRTCGFYFGGVLGFVLTALPSLVRRREYGRRGEWITAGVLICLNTAANVLFFYRGLDILTKNGCGGLGYPLAIGACVAGFSLYSLLILKEKFARLSLAGLAAVCFGIIIIAIR